MNYHPFYQSCFQLRARPGIGKSHSILFLLEWLFTCQSGVSPLQSPFTDIFGIPVSSDLCNLLSNLIFVTFSYLISISDLFIIILSSSLQCFCHRRISTQIIWIIDKLLTYDFFTSRLSSSRTSGKNRFKRINTFCFFLPYAFGDLRRFLRPVMYFHVRLFFTSCHPSGELILPSHWTFPPSSRDW